MGEGERERERGKCVGCVKDRRAAAGQEGLTLVGVLRGTCLFEESCMCMPRQRGKCRRVCQIRIGGEKTHVALKCPAVVHGEDKDDVTARVEGFGEDIEILGLGRPYALFRQSDG